MLQVLRDTIVQINLKTIGNNMDAIRLMCGNDVSIMAVIKANGYGHGAVDIVPTLMDHGADYLAVATLSEAIELRSFYENYPLFILGHTPDRLLPIVVESCITQTIFTIAQAEILNNIAKENDILAKVHLKIDTGFHRLGSDNLNELLKICKLPYLNVEGIFSHLALTSDVENQKQYNHFCEIISRLESYGISFKYKHIADSISCVDFPQYRMNMIRPGALIYGLKGFHKGNINVKQALSFVTRISQIRKISFGEGVGYDYLWKAPFDTRIGTVPFGYADGYPRNLRNKGYITVKGVKCPIIGIICMDQCMIDLTEVPDAKEGDLAIIYGDGDFNTMSIQEAADLSETNKNEIVARISSRPPRIYLA